MILSGFRCASLSLAQFTLQKALSQRFLPDVLVHISSVIHSAKILTVFLGR